MRVGRTVFTFSVRTRMGFPVCGINALCVVLAVLLIFVGCHHEKVIPTGTCKVENIYVWNDKFGNLQTFLELDLGGLNRGYIETFGERDDGGKLGALSRVSDSGNTLVDLGIAASEESGLVSSSDLGGVRAGFVVEPGDKFDLPEGRSKLVWRKGGQTISIIYSSN